jgi:hypothetical protein
MPWKLVALSNKINFNLAGIKKSSNMDITVDLLVFKPSFPHLLNRTELCGGNNRLTLKSIFCIF